MNAIIGMGYLTMGTQLSAQQRDYVQKIQQSGQHLLGIINDVWETATAQEFFDKIQTYAEQFCPPNRASKAVGRIKRAVQSGADLPFESALAVERELQQLLFQGDDAKEGLAAYIEKRKGVFTGK